MKLYSVKTTYQVLVAANSEEEALAFGEAAFDHPDFYKADHQTDEQVSELTEVPEEWQGGIPWSFQLESDGSVQYESDEDDEKPQPMLSNFRMTCEDLLKGNFSSEKKRGPKK